MMQVRHEVVEKFGARKVALLALLLHCTASLVWPDAISSSVTASSGTSLPEAPSSTTPKATSLGPTTSQQPVVEQKSGKFHRSMSCYVCSTMEYDNPSSNICKQMRQEQPHEIPSTHSTLRKLAAPFSSSFSIPSKDANSSTANANETSPTTTGESLMTTTTTDGLHHPSSSTGVRVRKCAEDETFCSIVSIVRLEFSKDVVDFKFWALERNCSKSCNKGCMLVGERIRLWICSQCCDTPECNSASGASARKRLFKATSSFIALLLGCLLVIKSTAWGVKR